MFFVDTWTNYFTPRVGRAAVMLLEAAGYQVYCPPTVCCGRPAISKGLLTEAAHLAEVNARALAHAVAAGVPIIGTEPSCLLTLADEYPQLLRSNGSKRIAAGALMIETFLDRLLADAPDALTFRSDARVLYHTHCHQKALVGSADAMRLLHRAFGERASEIPSGCCGMAGSFGHEVEHYNIARAIGEDRLFPAVRDRADAIVAVSGFSCRCQIEHHTDCSPLHLCELLVQSLVTTP
jgi:Fe-S oxidoreductase